MKVLIAGGAGFIGSHLCDRLLQDGHEVICADNFSSGSKDNITHLLANPKFTLIEQDICTPLPPKISNLSAIFHFASPASPNPDSPVSYMSHPVETLMVNSLGTKNMLDLAVKNNCQIIFASTSEVYGDPEVHPQPETYRGNVSPNGPRSCYDEGKRFMESIAFTYARKFAAKIKVIRIFNTYGPHMRLDDGRFTINLIDSYLNHKSFKMFGDGSSTRSFCYIDDLVEGIMLVAGSDQALGEVINLGNPSEIALIDAIKVFESVIGSELSKQREDSQPDDPHRRCPDITKVKQLLGWEPKIDFRTGIKKTLESYRHE
ncbi:MAG: GDP-mannose 4,6-dehydratase [bacterium]